MDTLKILQHTIHYSMHLLVPGFIAYSFYRENWKKVWLIFIATMLVDLDHLLSNPIFDPSRCSVGFHFLHSYPAIVIYGLFFLFAKDQTIKVIALGLLFHMFTDVIDCAMSNNFY